MALFNASQLLHGSFRYEGVTKLVASHCILIKIVIHFISSSKFKC